MSESKKPRETIALVKNKMYKTYQFHGIVGKGKDPDYVFRASIGTVFSWLRERFRQFEDIPNQLKLPEDPKAITDDMLRSFRMNDGYIIETIHVKEDGIWAFRLTEPDMGSSERQPAPGRLFLTNFAFCKNENEVEFGCQLICSQPDSIEEDAEVFRPRLVRDLMDKFGLHAICDLKYKAFDLSLAVSDKLLKNLMSNAERQMPIVILEKATRESAGKSSEKSADIESIVRNFDNMRDKKTLVDILAGSSQNQQGALLLDPEAALSVENDSFIQEANGIARTLACFAYVFYNAAGEKDRSYICYPNMDCLEEHSEHVLEKVISYPKRNEKYHFGQVLFYNEAMSFKQNSDLDKIKKSEDYIAENKALMEKIETLRKQLGDKKQIARDLSSAILGLKAQIDDLEFKSRQDRKRWEAEKAELERKNKVIQLELDEMSEQLNALERKEGRPDNAAAFVRWVENNFDDDIILLSRAKEGLKRAKNVDFDTLCDAVEVLACVYKKRRLGLINDEQYISGCMEKGDTAFEIALCGEQNIKRFAKDYKVPYHTDIKDKKNRRTLDQHFKSGVDPRHLVRIYFFWDDVCSKVVIGSMPDHLPVVSENQ